MKTPSKYTAAAAGLGALLEIGHPPSEHTLKHIHGGEPQQPIQLWQTLTAVTTSAITVSSTSAKPSIW